MKKLTKNKDKSVSNKANKLIDKWKKLIKKPNSEETDQKDESMSNANTLVSTNKNGVTSKTKGELSKNFKELNKSVLDKLTNSSDPPIRNSVRKILYEAFVNKEETDGNFKNIICLLIHIILELQLIKYKNLSQEIEQTIYNNLFKAEDKGSKYISRAKAIASNLQDKNNTDFKSAVVDGIFSPVEITTMDVKKMASSELQTKRQMVEKESFNSIRSDWADIHAPVGVGMYTCENCKGQRTTSKEIQLRGADEPMTL